MSRPTQETDACDLLSPNGEEAGNADYQRMLELARKLEGQRDELAEALALAINACDCYEKMQGLLVMQLPVGASDISLDALVRVRSNVAHCRKALATKEGGV